MNRSIRTQRREVIAAKHLFCHSSREVDELHFTTTPRSPMIALTPITTSSNLAAAGYDPVDRVFAVRFQNGKVYHHHNVAQDLAAGFNAAESKGSFYAREIKPGHPGELIVPAETDTEATA